jgi:hypothetical protein
LEFWQYNSVTNLKEVAEYIPYHLPWQILKKDNLFEFFASECQVETSAPFVSMKMISEKYFSYFSVFGVTKYIS